MEKINKYMWAMAVAAMFIVSIPLFVGGIDNNSKIENASMFITDNKTNINSESEITNPLPINLDNKKKAINKYKNMKPKKGEFKINLGAKADVKKEYVPKEKVIQAIANGDKKATEEDIVAIAEEFNMSTNELRRAITKEI